MIYITYFIKNYDNFNTSVFALLCYSNFNEQLILFCNCIFVYNIFVEFSNANVTLLSMFCICTTMFLDFRKTGMQIQFFCIRSLFACRTIIRSHRYVVFDLKISLSFHVIEVNSTYVVYDH